MSEPNSNRKPTSHSGFEWAGSVARMRRTGRSSRAGRRSVLLNMLASTYANAARGARSADPRTGSDR
jgi:hypothetical protein